MEDEHNPAPFPHVVVKLTEHEADFCLHVLASPGCKLDGGYAHWQEDGSEYGKYVADYENSERVGLVENTGGKRWKPTQKLIDLLKSTLTAAPSPSPKMTGLSQDVITLVIAAREAFDTGMLPSDENDALDKALEAFSSRVPYENEPKTKPCPACNGLGAFPETGYDCGECLGGGEVEAND